MGAGQSISKTTLDDLKNVSEKLKSVEQVEELEKRIKDIINEFKAKISSGNEAATPGDAKGETTAAEAAEATPAKQEGGKRLKKRRISNKKRVSHRLTRSLKLI